MRQVVVRFYSTMAAQGHSLTTMWFYLQEAAAEEPTEEDQEIVPGGDPDAGMPAEQADMHGTQRGSPPPTDEPEIRSHPPATDGLDNIEVENNVEEDSDTKVVTQPPPPDSD